MSKKQTTPQGHEIPIPSRKDVFKDLAKVAKPKAKPKSSRRSKK